MKILSEQWTTEPRIKLRIYWLWSAVWWNATLGDILYVAYHSTEWTVHVRKFFEPQKAQCLLWAHKMNLRVCYGSHDKVITSLNTISCLVLVTELHCFPSCHVFRQPWATLAGWCSNTTLKVFVCHIRCQFQLCCEGWPEIEVSECI